MNSPTKFSVWMRSNLKDAYSGLITQDIDFIVKSIDNKIYIIEEKIYKNARTGPAQAIIYKMLKEVLSSLDEFEACIKLSDVSNGKAILNDTSEVKLEELFLGNQENLYTNDPSWFELIIEKNLSYLWDGIGIPPYKKTENERTFFRNSKLISWLEENALEFASIDWIFVNYCTGYFITICESSSKLDSLQQKIVDTLHSSEITSNNPKSKVQYQYLGNYFIEYSDDFEKIKLNGVDVSSDEAIELLNLFNDEISNYN